MKKYLNKIRLPRGVICKKIMLSSSYNITGVVFLYNIQIAAKLIIIEQIGDKKMHNFYACI